MKVGEIMIRGNRYYNTNTSIRAFFLSVLILCYIVTKTMPFFMRVIDAKIVLIIVCLLYFKIIFGSRKSLNDSLLFLLPFIGMLLIEIIYAYNYQSNFMLSLYDLFLLLFSPLLGFYLLSRNHRKLVKLIIMVMIATFFITSITSYFGLKNDPSSARWLASVRDSQDSYYIFLNLKNIGGYTTVYSIVLIYPMLIALFKQNRIKLIQFIAIFLAFGIYVIYAQYTTAIILFFSSSILILFPKNLSNKRMLYIGISIVIFTFIIKPFLGDLFYYLSNSSTSTDVSQRLYVVGDLLKGIENTTQANTRTPLILYDIRIFYENLLFGSMFFEGGINSGHSFILNTLAKSGLIGGVALFIMYRHIYRTFYFPFHKKPYYGYMLWSFTLGIILSIVNTGSWLFVISFFVPLIAYNMQNDSYKCLQGKGLLIKSNCGKA